MQEDGKQIMAKKGSPQNIVFATVLQADDGPENAQNGVIRGKGELRRLLRRLAPLLAGSLDFDKGQLIFVALGRCESGGREAQITAVVYFTDRGNGLPPLAEIWYRENSIDLLVAKPDIVKPTCPIHVIKLKKLDGETIFNKN
jgi:hypothetical protein